MSFNQLYQNNKNVWGDKPSKLVSIIFSNLRPSSSYLDLGCGQGKDALFMAKNNFQVTAIDSSLTAIDQLKKMVKENELNNLLATQADIRNFVIEENKYDVIHAGNVLQFLGKTEAKDIIDAIKKNIFHEGFVLLSSFTTDDPSYENKKEDRTYFKPQEMLDYFKDFKIIYYFENKILDQGHPGSLEPHKHGIVEIIAQKI